MEHWEMVSGKLVNVISNTPELLWQNAIYYFKWCDENPIMKKQTLASGKEAGKKVEQELRRPYSIKALCLHCNITEDYIKSIRQSKDQRNPYYIVISKVLYIIYTQNLEGAMTDTFNPIFTARVLNMEKEEVSNNPVTVTVRQGLPSLANSENEILEKLELEKPLSKLE